ncbi:DUF4349 domain-containing protein [Sanguibacter antarcticus]|uniref:Uncharacterized protein DUF4349 n=1 Tax=Sanguibacter antarcticus TaxID=372484 RepID=A0A2A9E5N1_9MICO|nr:DUF4349 domain-containing protein [Sanguibacter antarcticus]PFG33675.1 uncharacterized protein DUF4349 [Sanguibacter antarcticus]
MTRPLAASRRPSTVPRLLVVFTSGLVAAGLLAGCSSSGTQDSASVAQEVDQQAVGGVDGLAADAAASASDARSVVETTQQMVTTGTVEVVVDDPVAAAEEISALVEQAGGRTEQRNQQVRTETSEPRADLTVRVPADKVTPTITALGDVGTVEATRISSTDVGGQARDLDARIKALQTSTTRLETLMSTAETTADLLDAESTLTARQGDLESLQAQLNALADQVDLSTLVITLTTEPTTPDTETPTFWEALATGWGALVATATTVVVIVGVLLPWLATLAVIALLVRWLVRRLRTRRTMVPSPQPRDPARPPSDMHA